MRKVPVLKTMLNGDRQWDYGCRSRGWEVKITGWEGPDSVVYTASSNLITNLWHLLRT